MGQYHGSLNTIYLIPWPICNSLWSLSLNVGQPLTIINMGIILFTNYNYDLTLLHK